jgi:microcystin-dependent protein
MVNPFIAEVIMFGGNFAPRGWAKCEGQLLAISSNTALFSILGTTYGGNGRSTFGLPDLRSRNPIGSGNGPGLSNYHQGAGGGHEETTLDVAHIASHSHSVSAKVKASFTPPSGGANSGTPAGNNFSSSTTNIYSSNGVNVDMASNAVDVKLGSTGGNVPFSDIQPWCSVQFIIALFGVYPSRS